ncbi:hypothetical protein WJX72_006625 [[Myrmecia] bisecta]|uniref:RanBD1 domain-containing protein n=1 Tax=[Myrmecia] bisecta TaxID=41462 RepID=A0AAW1QFH8_9CHLO
MSKRPTDHLEPSSKRGKRGSDRQLTKDDPSDSDEDNEGVEAGTFQRASEDRLRNRTPRRKQAVALQLSQQAPLQLRLQALQLRKPLVSRVLVPPSPPAQASPHSSAAGTAATSGFGLLGATAGTSGSSLLGSSSSTDAAKPGGFSFDTKAAFSFSTTPASSAFPSVQSVFGSSTSQLFGGSGPSGQSTPAVKLAEEAAVTGEEDETGVFTGDGVLYEFDEAKQWRERGRGELHVNRAASGQARLVMRQKGNLRLLLNANLFPEMTVTTMDGGKGVTFQCINHAKGGEEKPGEGEAKPAEAPALATFAYRIKQPGQVEEFKRVIETHKAGPKKANGEEQV